MEVRIDLTESKDQKGAELSIPKDIPLDAFEALMVILKQQFAPTGVDLPIRDTRITLVDPSAAPIAVPPLELMADKLMKATALVHRLRERRAWEDAGKLNLTGSPAAVGWVAKQLDLSSTEIILWLRASRSNGSDPNEHSSISYAEQLACRDAHNSDRYIRELIALLAPKT